MASAPRRFSCSARSSDAIQREAGTNPGAPSPLGQLAHLAFPLATGEQGVLDEEGVPAVLVQVSANAGRGRARACSGARLEGVGRGVLSAVDALDTAPDIAQAKQAGILIQHKLMPEWAIRLLTGTLLLPPLVAGPTGWPACAAAVGPSVAPRSGR